MSAQVDVLEMIEHDGDRWNVIAKGVTRQGDGFVYCHLASATRFVQQRNGRRPVQIADWIDPRKLAAPLSSRVRPDVEAAPWVIAEIRKLEQREAAVAALIAERDALREALREAEWHLSCIGTPRDAQGGYHKDGEWTFGDALPNAADAREVASAFALIRAALATGESA